MQVTIDIPEPVFLEIQEQAQRERKSPTEVLLERASVCSPRMTPAAALKQGRIAVPLLPSNQPGSFDPGEGGIYDYVEFP